MTDINKSGSAGIKPKDGKLFAEQTEVLSRWSKYIRRRKTRVYACFIDYTKVRHEEIKQILRQPKFDGDDIRLLVNLYRDQIAAMKMRNQLSKCMLTRRGVRHGCILSPGLFSLLNEIIIKPFEDEEGISVGGRNITNIRFANDTVFVAKSKAKLQKILEKGVEEIE